MWKGNTAMQHTIRNTSIHLIGPVSLLFCLAGSSTTLHVGSGYPFRGFGEAARHVKPGDTVLIHSGTHPGDQWVEDLSGTAEDWIYILGEDRENTVFEGGVGAWILTDPAYLEIRNLTFARQTHNGLNIHDGDSYATPGKHLRFIDCTFENIQGNGNFDFLKLSGVDSFEVRSCLFRNGSMGSGIDMVGCHDVVVRNCLFEDLPGGGVQAKGGSHRITIERNRFVNCGIRAVNVGGSTDLEYFRPRDVQYQASRIHVIANVFVGGVSAIAFAGAVDSRAVHNTIVNPTSFVVRILQEQSEGGRFALCGDNAFHNNLVYLERVLWEEVDVGPETRPETVSFSNNLWFTLQKPSRKPNTPVPEMEGVYGKNPGFANIDSGDFRISPESPAVGSGREREGVFRDIADKPYANPPAIGAYEANSGVEPDETAGGATGFRGIILQGEYYATLFRYYLMKAARGAASVVGLR